MSGHAHSVDSTHYPIPNIVVHPVEIRHPHYIPSSSASFDEWNLVNPLNTGRHFLLPNVSGPPSPRAPSPLCARKRYRACSDSALYDSCNAAAAASSSPFSSVFTYGAGGGSTGAIGGATGGVITSSVEEEMYARRRNIGLCRSQPVIQQFSDDEGAPALSYPMTPQRREARSLDRRDIRSRHMYKSAQDLKITRSASDSGYPHSSTEVDDEDYDLSTRSRLRVKETSQVKSYCESLHSNEEEPSRCGSTSPHKSTSPNVNNAVKRLKYKKYLQTRYQQSQEYSDVYSTNCDCRTDKHSTDDESYPRNLSLTPELSLSHMGAVSSLSIKTEPVSPSASVQSEPPVFCSSLGQQQQLSPYYNGALSPRLNSTSSSPGASTGATVFQFGDHSSLPFSERRSFEDQPYLQDRGQGHHRRDLSPRRLSRIGPLSSSVSSIDRLEQQNEKCGGAGTSGGSTSHLTGISQLKHPSFTHISNPQLLHKVSPSMTNLLATQSASLQSTNQDALNAFRRTQNENVYALQQMMVTNSALMTYKCFPCNAVFMDYQSLNIHSLSHKNDTVFNFGADKLSSPKRATRTSSCGSTTAPSTPATGSSSSSSSSKAHVCRVCGRGFTRSDMLTRHTRLHTGLKPYECSVCSQVFSRSDHLHTHVRTHTGEKPYRCTQCSYAAPRRDMITRHSRIHAKQWQKKRSNNNLLVTAQSSSLSSNESTSIDIPNTLLRNASSIESNEEIHYRAKPNFPSSKLREMWSETSVESLETVLTQPNEPMLTNELGAKLQRCCRTSDVT